MRATKRRNESRTPIWSPRSQKCQLAIRDLMAAREKVRGQITFSEKRIVEGKEAAVTQTRMAAAGSYSAQQRLKESLASVEEHTRLLAAYREEEARLTERISALVHPSPAARRKRAKLQGQAASLIAVRRGKDRVIDCAVNRLRMLLEERRELSEKLHSVAALLDFAAGIDLDTGRLDALSASLPSDLLAQSDTWAHEFVGQGKGRKLLAVGRTGAVLPETLAHCGVYGPGETAFLSEREAALLPPDESGKRRPTPVEMELAAGNTLPAPAPAPTPTDADFPVSALPVTQMIL